MASSPRENATKGIGLVRYQSKGVGVAIGGYGRIVRVPLLSVHHDLGGGSDISSGRSGTAPVPTLLLVLALAPHAAGGETIGGPGYRYPGMFQYDYQSQSPIEAFPVDPKPNAVAPSFKPEFRNTDYYSLSQGLYLQQHIARMGYRFRDISEADDAGFNTARFRPQPARGSGYLWRSGEGWAGPAPIFRPLDNVELKKSEVTTGRGAASGRAVTPAYGLAVYGIDAPGYTPAVPVFRPMP